MPPIWEKRQLIIQILGHQVDNLLVLVVAEVHHCVQVPQLLARLLQARKDNY